MTNKELGQTNAQRILAGLSEVVESAEGRVDLAHKGRLLPPAPAIATDRKPRRRT